MAIDINAIITLAIAKEVNLIIDPLINHIHAIEADLKELRERQPTIPVDEIPEDWAKRDALTNAFVEKLNNQEWFWNKINDYIRDGIERYGEPVSREEVAEIVKELWNEDYRSEVEDIAEQTVVDHDHGSEVRRVLRDATVTIDI